VNPTITATAYLLIGASRWATSPVAMAMFADL
jgi:hypothetical protein